MGVASPCGKLEKFSRLAKLDNRLVQLFGLVGAERDLEDYLVIPDTNVNGHSWDFHYKSNFPNLGFPSTVLLDFSTSKSLINDVLKSAMCIKLLMDATIDCKIK